MERAHDSVLGGIAVNLFVLCLGLIVLIPAANTFFTYLSYRSAGTFTHGTIIHASASRDLGGRPLIQYHDDLGGLHEFKSKAKTHWFKRPKVGEKIGVFFSGENGDNAIVNNYFHYVFLPLLFVLAGCYCCLKSIGNIALCTEAV